MEPSFRNRLISLNQFLVMMRVNCIPTQSVNLCQQDFTRCCDSDTETGSFIPWQNRTRGLENMFLSYLQRIRPDCENESFWTTGRQKNDCFNFHVFWYNWNTVFEAMGCFFQFSSSQEVPPSLTGEDILRGIEKKELGELRWYYRKQKATLCLKRGVWFVETVQKRHYSQRKFPYERLDAEDHSFEEIKYGKLLGFLSVRHRGLRKVQTLSCKLFSYFQKHSIWWQRLRQVEEAVCRRRRLVVSTSQKAKFKVQATNWSTHYSSAIVLSEVGAGLHKNIPVPLSTLRKN